MKCARSIGGECLANDAESASPGIIIGWTALKWTFRSVVSKEVKMRKHVLVLTTIAAILAFGADAVIAQQGVTGPDILQSPTAQPSPHGMMGDHPGMMGHGMMGDHPGMMGHGMMGDHPGMMGMMGHGVLGRDYGHHGSVMARIIFSLMDADGDGKLTLQEWQAAHERIFKAMDTDHDGTVTLEEMEAFIHGH
jgi:hypothetical protein